MAQISTGLLALGTEGARQEALCKAPKCQAMQLWGLLQHLTIVIIFRLLTVQIMGDNSLQRARLSEARKKNSKTFSPN